MVVYPQFPTLMEKIAYLMRVDMGPALKTPTDLYKSFDRILENETLLDSIDVKCNCNIIELLLKVTKKCSPALITETEADDVLKKRQGWFLPDLKKKNVFYFPRFCFQGISRCLADGPTATAFPRTYSESHPVTLSSRSRRRRPPTPSSQPWRWTFQSRKTWRIFWVSQFWPKCSSQSVGKRNK